MDLTTWFALFMVFIGSFVQTATGFGLAILTAPVLILISSGYVPAPITVVALVLSIVNAYHYRNDLSLAGLKMAIIGRVPGTVLGGVLLMFATATELALLIGILVLFAVGISLMPFRISPTPHRMFWAGFFSGLFGTSSSIGGPPMALLMQHEEANHIRANLAAFFVVSSILALIMQMYVGHFGWWHMQLALPLLPASLLGYWVAIRFAKHWSKKTIRRLSLWLCSISGTYGIISYVLEQV